MNFNQAHANLAGLLAAPSKHLGEMGPDLVPIPWTGRLNASRAIIVVESEPVHHRFSNSCRCKHFYAFRARYPALDQQPFKVKLGVALFEFVSPLSFPGCETENVNVVRKSKLMAGEFFQLRGAPRTGDTTHVFSLLKNVVYHFKIGIANVSHRTPKPPFALSRKTVIVRVFAWSRVAIYNHHVFQRFQRNFSRNRAWGAA